jgi:hypothetical protein
MAASLDVVPARRAVQKSNFDGERKAFRVASFS